MPHLVEMDKKMRRKGLVLIGAEVQGGDPESIAAFAKKHDVTFPMTKGTTRPKSLNGIPHMTVFDVEGTCVFDGHPNAPECEDAIKEALKEATPVEETEEDSTSLLSRSDLVPERDWVNTDGNKLTATLVSLDGTTGTFRKSNGQTFPYDITKLSEADQEVISAAAEKTAE
jgi:hypothetical protein